VRALVVLPTASRASIVSSAPFSPDISAMPAALSAIGPNPSRARTMPMTASMPIVARVVPYMPPMKGSIPNCAANWVPKK
jgi:hypothetical protein